MTHTRASMLMWLVLALLSANISLGNTLQDQVRAAEPGDTIVVAPGVYPGPITIDRPLTLLGNGAAIIDAGGSGDAIKIVAPDVTIRGFTIRNTGKSLDKENAGIVVTAPRATIEQNILKDVLFGLYLKGAPGCIIRNNTIGGKDLAVQRRGDGIRLWQSPGCLIEDNVIDSSRDTIMWFSDDVILRRNKVHNGRYGMHFMYSDRNILEDNDLSDNSVGAFLMYSHDLTLRRNVFARNRGPSGFGVGLKDMDGLIAEDNIFAGNRVGLHLDNSPSQVNIYHDLRHNVFAFNDIGVGFMPSVRRNRFSENTFLENIEQIAILGSGVLRDNDFSIDGKGNFWSDYRGYDFDGDGIGESPYKSVSVFETLIEREPSMRLFMYSPAQHAIELASRAFPIVEPKPKMIDNNPLVRPIIAKASIPTPATNHGFVAAATLLFAALACLFLAAPTPGERKLQAATITPGNQA